MKRFLVWPVGFLCWLVYSSIGLVCRYSVLP
jgi:hypothetical protein